MLVEPSRTEWDLRFSCFGVPVRVHPFFWLTGVLLGSRGLENSPNPLGELLLWVAVVFVSILVHEMGHAVAIRAFGWRPWITLYAFGGLASYDRGYSHSYSSYSRKGNTPQGQILISAAGPIAGFLLAGLVVLGLFIAGRQIMYPILAWNVPLGRGEPMYDDSIWLRLFVHFMLFINIYWGLVNLLPVYPLDGGQISRELFTAYGGSNGYQQSLILSIFCGAGLAVYGLARSDLWLAILFGMLAYQSYQLLQHHRGGWGGGWGGGRPW